jgi:type IV secretion system protein VirD4
MDDLKKTYGEWEKWFAVPKNKALLGAPCALAGAVFHGEVPWVVAGAVGFALPWVLPYILKSSDRTNKKTAHGSAEWTERSDAKAMVQEQGFILGTLDPARIDRASGAVINSAPLLRYTEPGNAVATAPMRSGKGVAIVVPNTLEWEGSVVVIDPKLENAVITRRDREKRGQKVRVFAPFADESCAINPLDWMRDGDELAEDATALANALVEMKADSKDDHFVPSARIVMRGFIMYAKLHLPPEKRNLPGVLDLLTLPEAKMTKLLEDTMRECGGAIERAAGILLAAGDRERGSFFTTLRRSLGWLDVSPKLARRLCTNDVDWSDLVENKLSLFLGIPDARLEMCRPLLRCLVVMAIETILRAGKKPNPDVLFMLDEAASLGYLEQLETLYQLGGQGWRACMIFQDLGQIEKTYPNPRLFKSCAIRLFFGTSDLETAKEISETLGKETIETKSSSVSNPGFLKTKTKTDNTQEIGRDLLTPDEVMKLPPETMICFLRGRTPLKLYQAKYFERSEFAGRWDAPPK